MKVKGRIKGEWICTDGFSYFMLMFERWFGNLRARAVSSGATLLSEVGKGCVLL